jgi:hypothetical protein
VSNLVETITFRTLGLPNNTEWSSEKITNKRMWKFVLDFQGPVMTTERALLLQQNQMRKMESKVNQRMENKSK